jgi:TolB-like protein
VVPFRCLDDPSTLAEHAADDVIRILGGLTTWIAVTRTPLDQVRAPIDLLRLRHTFSARYVLHGAVERQRGMLRLSAELNEAETGRVLWSDRFERSAEHAGALRDEAAPRIASAIAPLLAQRELDRIALQPPEALTAQDMALRAYAAVVQPEPVAFQTARDWLRQALDRPGPHAAVHFATVAWHLMAVGQGWSRDPEWDSRAAATAAEGMDRNDPEALALLGYLHSLLHRDHHLSLALLDRVIELAPYCGKAWMLKSDVLSQLGLGEEAIFAAERAEAMPVLGPERAWRCQSAAMACYVGERYADAVRWARVGAMHYPGLAINERVMAASLAVLGRLDEAQQAADRLLRIDPSFRVGLWRQRSLFTADCRERYAQRLRLAGLPE